MGVLSTPSTPQPEVVKEESQSGIGNVDNSKTSGEHRWVNDYSIDLNFVSLHLNTLASAGSMILIVLTALLFARWMLTGGVTQMWETFMGLSCLWPCQCCHRDGASQDQVHLKASTPSTQQGPSSQHTASHPQGVSAGGTGGSQQDPEPPGGNISELHASLMKELKALRRAARTNKRMGSNLLDIKKMLKDEILDLRRVMQNNQSQQRDATNVPIYPELHRDSSMIREFFNSVVDPYRLDEDRSISSASVDSGNNSVEDNI